VCGQALDNCRSSRRRGGPDEEDGADTAQSFVERLWHGEVAGDDFDVRWQRGRRFGATDERADRHARVEEQVDDGAPDPAGRSGYEHRRHSLRPHADLDVVCRSTQ
jgi:hypothetical protein